MSSTQPSRNLRSTANNNTSVDIQSVVNPSNDLSQNTTSPDNWVKYFDKKFGDIERTMQTNDSNVKDLTQRITELEHSVGKSVDYAIETAKESLEFSRATRNLVNDLKSEIDILKNSLLKSNKIQKSFEESLLKHEMYSRKRNLIFSSFDMIQCDCETAVKQILNILNLSNISYEQAHFLYNKKQFIVRFQSLNDRDRVWKAKKNLSGSRYFLSEDLPSAIKKQHDELFIVSKKARSLTKYDKVYLQANKLTIDGKTYTGDNIQSLPDDINPCYLSQRTSDNVVCFGGRLSRYNPLSNFYEVPFVYNNTKFSSSEQAIQHTKAVKFGDNAQAQLILHSNDCGEQKQFGKHVSNFEQHTWKSVRTGLITDILKAKFSQNKCEKDYLCDTKSRVIGEASMNDATYGIGLPIHHSEVLNTDRWDGQNELGKMLMSVRASLKKIRLYFLCRMYE